MGTSSPKPRVLIVDDDQVSLRFLEAAVAQSGCTVVAAVDGATALKPDCVFDLLMIDRGLPDIDGVELLHALRQRGNRAPAIATSAAIDAAQSTQLHAAGFVDVLEKPASVMRIHEIVTLHLPQTAPVLIDGEAALDSVAGDATALRALRGLLAQELEQLEWDLTHDDLATDRNRLGERLHRLRAACGFCGAVGLMRLAAGWQKALRAGTLPDDEQRDSLLALCRKTAVAMRGS